MNIPVVRTIAALRAKMAGWRRENRTVALVPTMGALHAGHLVLVQEGMRQADRVVVSVFVNPTQFGLEEDLAHYPRVETLDRNQLATVGASLLFAPTVMEMYPAGFSTTITVTGVSEGLCGTFRPTYFAGVATVVTKLLLQSLPNIALFGEKDYQQLQVIRRLVRDLDIPVHVISVPTVREIDGLALSSRNAYLSPEERQRAIFLYRILREVSVAVACGTTVDTATNMARIQVLATGFDAVDYLEVRDSDTLTPLSGHVSRPARVLAAAWLGRTRLIDNVPVLPRGDQPTTDPDPTG
ncbi:Pantoate--beta-alanine ligase [invertebrate metagenome]|uniref:pantoate--beta-alanine ligase (AMP-forming) n=1 Tax=invertebrate metagenome TaxID=1711999 RepID=A0A484H5M2_9ZZZZ